MPGPTNSTGPLPPGFNPNIPRGKDGKPLPQSTVPSPSVLDGQNKPAPGPHAHELPPDRIDVGDHTQPKPQGEQPIPPAPPGPSGFPPLDAATEAAAIKLGRLPANDPARAALLDEVPPTTDAEVLQASTDIMNGLSDGASIVEVAAYKKQVDILIGQGMVTQPPLSAEAYGNLTALRGALLTFIQPPAGLGEPKPLPLGPEATSAAQQLTQMLPTDPGYVELAQLVPPTTADQVTQSCTEIMDGLAAGASPAEVAAYLETVDTLLGQAMVTQPALPKELYANLCSLRGALLDFGRSNHVPEDRPLNGPF